MASSSSDGRAVPITEAPVTLGAVLDLADEIGAEMGRLQRRVDELERARREQALTEIRRWARTNRAAPQN